MKLKIWRMNAGYSQEELARIAGCTAATICRLEQGARTPSPRLCGRLFQITNGAVNAQDHQEAWESYVRSERDRKARRFTAICNPSGILPDAVAAAG